MQLKTLLREYIENQRPAPTRRWDFLPNFGPVGELPVPVENLGWELTDDLERTIRFETREDLQDFVVAYMELEDETGTYVPIRIDGFSITISSDSEIPPKFKATIEEIAREIRGH